VPALAPASSDPDVLSLAVEVVATFTPAVNGRDEMSVTARDDNRLLRLSEERLTLTASASPSSTVDPTKYPVFQQGLSEQRLNVPLDTL